MSNYWADDMRRFMILGEQTIGKFNEDQAWRYVGHMLEESTETELAMHLGDYVNVIEGAVNTISKSISLLHSLGVEPFRAWDVVHKAMIKGDGSSAEEELAKLWNAVES
jgi:hypothetical protein